MMKCSHCGRIHTNAIGRCPFCGNNPVSVVMPTAFAISTGMHLACETEHTPSKHKKRVATDEK
jgi:hypothetical protein